MAGTIGIKIANGDFYPIIEENSPRKKRLVLTTAHDDQENVQIDLFRSLSKSMLDAQYIGSLVVESMRKRPRGEPSIEMIISCDGEGNITADAYDLDIAADGEHHTLNVSLKTIDEAGQKDGPPDFDFRSDRPNALYSRTDEDKEEARKFPWLIMGLATVFVVIVIALLWFLFNTNGHIRHIHERSQLSQSGQPEPVPAPAVPQPQPAAPQPQAAPATPQPAAPQPQAAQPLPAPPPAPPPVIQAPSAPPAPRPQAAQRKRPPAPVLSYKVPAVIPKNGVVYQIQWGDTLWDISAAFYRNPWLYPRIARYNNIKNPDLIISGFNVRIPPLN